MNQDLVTIFIPTYNRAAWLGQAIASAVAQNYGAIEILICDNASTDQTPTICHEWAAADSRVRLIRHSRNLGMIGNWRQAFVEHARGKWIVILSDDDYFCDPSYIERAARHFVDDRIGLIYADGEFLDEPSGAMEKLSLPALGKINGRQTFATFRRETQAFMLCNIVFNRDKSLQAWPDLFSFEWNLASDAELFLRLCLDYDLVALAGPSTLCRRHTENASRYVDLSPELAWGQLWGHVAPVELALRRGYPEAETFLDRMPLDLMVAEYLFSRLCNDVRGAYGKFRFMKSNAPILYARVLRHPYLEWQQIVGAVVFGRYARRVLVAVGSMTGRLRKFLGRPKRRL